MDAPSAAVGHRLRALRQAVPVRMADLAEAAGCSYRHLQMIERGARLPSPELAALLAQALSKAADRTIAVADFYDPAVARRGRPAAAEVPDTHAADVA